MQSDGIVTTPLGEIATICRVLMVHPTLRRNVAFALQMQHSDAVAADNRRLREDLAAVQAQLAAVTGHRDAAVAAAAADLAAAHRHLEELTSRHEVR